MDKKLKLGGYPFLIAFSGGCYSGKTSTMNALKSILENEYGLKVVIVNEAIRETEIAKSGASIESIRHNADNYFRLQKEIIQKKYNQELEANACGEPTVFLFDRALTDSLFYYETCVDKSRLSEKREYYKFHKWLIDRIGVRMSRMDMVIEFKPLDNTNANDDKMRPVYLKQASAFEYECISRLNYAYCRKDKQHGFMSVNLNDPFYNNIIEQIIENMQLICKAQGR